MVNSGILPWLQCFKAPLITVVSVVYRGILPWFTMMYHGLHVSKHHGIYNGTFSIRVLNGIIANFQISLIDLDA